MLLLRLGLCLLSCAMWLALTAASEASQRTAALVRTDTAPVIDGVLDEPVWSEGVLLEPMIQTLPIEGDPPTEHTEIRLLYDRDFLYLGIRMYDSDPGALIAKQMVHDADMTSDDRINLSFDTFNDHRNAYFFQINPAGTRSDALIENNRTFRRDWNGIWYAESSVDDEGWSAEFAIPFKTVSFDARAGTWGFEAERQIRRKNEVGRWANPSKNRTVVDVAGIGTLTGLGEVDGTGIDIVPNGSLRYTWDRKRQADGTSTDTDLLANPGAEVYYKFHPSMTAALAVNTDFIEAPVDDRRTELTRFPPFFPERRDFFLQDAGVFEFGNIKANGFPYFSRRVGRLGWRTPRHRRRPQAHRPDGPGEIRRHERAAAPAARNRSDRAERDPRPERRPRGVRRRHHRHPRRPSRPRLEQHGGNRLPVLQERFPRQQHRLRKRLLHAQLHERRGRRRERLRSQPRLPQRPLQRRDRLHPDR